MQKNIILSIFKGVMVLSIITLVCTVLLGVFNILTAVDPLQIAYDKFSQYSSDKRFTKMLEENWEADNAKIVYFAQSTDGTTNAFLSKGNGGYGGPVEVYVIINVSTNLIERVELGAHDETYIGSLNRDGFFDRIKNKDITTLQDSSIDHTSGATWSSNAIKRAVLAITDYYAKKPEMVKDQTASSSPAQRTINNSKNEQVLVNDAVVQNRVSSLQDKILQNKQGGLL